jgi:hypothetical protein
MIRYPTLGMVSMTGGVTLLAVIAVVAGTFLWAAMGR